MCRNGPRIMFWLLVGVLAAAGMRRAGEDGGGGAAVKKKKNEPVLNTPQKLFTAAKKWEKEGRRDEAIGGYLAAYRLATAAKGSNFFRKVAKRAKSRLRVLDTERLKLKRKRSRIAREILQVAREYKRKKDYEQALLAYALLSRLVPAELAYAETYHDLLREWHKPRKLSPPRGYKAIFNHYDFTRWEVPSGVWRIKAEVMTGRDGIIILEDRPVNFKLRLEYRAVTAKGESAPVLWIHRDLSRPSGARIPLAGKNAGLIENVKPEKRFVRFPEKGRSDLYILAKPSNYKLEGWNRLEVTVKRRHAIMVKLNKKIIFRTAHGSRIPGWMAEYRQAFPGHIQIDSGSGIEIKSISLAKFK